MNKSRSALAKTAHWIGSHRLEIFLLFVILALGAYFRLYRIAEYLSFRGDEGRDALVVRQMLMNRRPILVGPATSIGGMLLGPLYYYLMAPALWLWDFSPVGPAVMVALTGVATIGLIWFAGRFWFPSTFGIQPGVEDSQAQPAPRLPAGALSAALLYAASPLVIEHARSSWNPNILPFWALLAVFSLWRAWEGLNFKWLVVAGLAFAGSLQSHYLAIALAVPMGIFWLLALLRVRRISVTDGRRLRARFLLYTLGGAFTFLLLTSPLLIFDARQGWGNLKAIASFLGENPTSTRPAGELLARFGTVVATFVSRLVVGAPGPGAVPGVSIAIYTAALGAVSQSRSGQGRTGASWLLLIWLASGLLGLTLVPGEVFDHYYTLLFPAPFLLFGGWVQALQNRAYGGGSAQRFIFGLSLAAVAALLILELVNNPLRVPPGRELQRSEIVARKIAAEASGEPLNLAVIAERNYEDAYRYFLKSWEIPVVEIDPKRPKASRAGQLFIVCELPRERCDPGREPQAVLSKFGRSQVTGEWKLAGVMLYRLVPRQ